MVTLFVSDSEQITMLELFMQKCGVEYNIEVDDGRYGLRPPYIKVYEVPLDEKRAFNWVKENYVNE